MNAEAGDLAYRALVYENSLGSARRITIAIRCWRLSCLLSSSRSRGRSARARSKNIGAGYPGIVYELPTIRIGNTN